MTDGTFSILTKQISDAAIGWIDYTPRFFQLRCGEYVSELLYAETRSKPRLGFSPHGHEVTLVRLCSEFDTKKTTDNLTLLENGKPFGRENGWAIEKFDYDPDTGEILWYWLVQV
jgi:hypothetical protein